VFLDDAIPESDRSSSIGEGDAQPEIQSLSDMRDPQQIDIPSL